MPNSISFMRRACFTFAILLASTFEVFALNAGDVQNFVQAACGCQIISVFMGDPNDKSTWTITFSPGVTDQQKAVAQDAMAAYVQPPSSMQIASTAYPALNGTYPIDAGTQQRVQALSIYVAVNGKFPANQSTQAWPDTSRTFHYFPTIAEWQAFASAMADFVTQIDLGQNPTQPVSIP